LRRRHGGLGYRREADVTNVSAEQPFASDALEQELEPGYTRSNGQRVPLSSMATPHLKSAHAKLAREWPDHPDVAPMAAVIAQRDAEYQASQAAQQEGVQ
jgi:hypothetical protein